MAFHEVRFPPNQSFGSVGGPERRTEIVTLANGFEERNTPWQHSRRRYDAGVGLRSLNDVETLIAFFEARAGQLHGFRWKDWSDYKSCVPLSTPSPEDQLIGIGDGVTTVFQLQKTYQSGLQNYVRPIRKPVAGTVLVAVAGDPKVETLEFSVDLETGQIRFVTDRIQTSVASFQAGDVPNVPVVEVRL
jgi:uncharacterized protein (TIGR02217 family)